MNVTLTDPSCFLYRTPLLSGLEGGILVIDNGKIEVVPARNLDVYGLCDNIWFPGFWNAAVDGQTIVVLTGV